MSVYEVAVATHELLTRHDLTHGFGGALALNYYADPRATIDVDVNVFVPWSTGVTLVDLFEEIDFRPQKPTAEALPVAGIRLRRPGDRISIDLFFSLDDAYDEIASRLRWHPFGPDDQRLPFMSAEDVVAFKLSSNRDKDWVDIRKVLEGGPPLDLDYLERITIALRGPSMYPRIARLRSMSSDAGS